MTPNSLATDKPVAFQFRIELDELEMLVFDEKGKPEYPEKNLSEQGENQQQTQPTYDAGFGNRTQATLIGGERSHHCATLAFAADAFNSSQIQTQN